MGGGALYQIELIYDICCALVYLHSQEPCIVHGDLKPSNILIELFVKRPRAKILDFGLSRLVTHRALPLGGTMHYVAPEVILEPLGRPKPSADVFSFGRLMYFISTGKQPFKGSTGKKIVTMVKTGQLPQLAWPKSSPLEERITKVGSACLEFEASLRPDTATVLAEVSEWPF